MHIRASSNILFHTCQTYVVQSEIHRPILKHGFCEIHRPVIVKLGKMHARSKKTVPPSGIHTAVGFHWMALYSCNERFFTNNLNILIFLLRQQVINNLKNQMTSFKDGMRIMMAFKMIAIVISMHIMSIYLHKKQFSTVYILVSSS